MPLTRVASGAGVLLASRHVGLLFVFFQDLGLVTVNVDDLDFNLWGFGLGTIRPLKCYLTTATIIEPKTPKIQFWTEIVSMLPTSFG